MKSGSPDGRQEGVPGMGRVLDRVSEELREKGEGGASWLALGGVG